MDNRMRGGMRHKGEASHQDTSPFPPEFEPPTSFSKGGVCGASPPSAIIGMEQESLPSSI
jgi:hypothetical protein